MCIMISPGYQFIYCFLRIGIDREGIRKLRLQSIFLAECSHGPQQCDPLAQRHLFHADPLEISKNLLGFIGAQEGK